MVLSENYKCKDEIKQKKTEIIKLSPLSNLSKKIKQFSYWELIYQPFDSSAFSLIGSIGVVDTIVAVVSSAAIANEYKEFG